MKKVLPIYNEKGIKFILNYDLNQLLITIAIKKNDFWKEAYNKEFVITDDFNLEKLIDEIYVEYSKLKEIEMIWEENLKKIEVIELNIDIDEDD